MKITLLIPALNEANSIEKTIREIPKEFVDEILVIDGNSVDDTVAIAKSLGCRVLLQPGKGFGDALRFGFKNAGGDVIVVMDADGSPDPKEIPLLRAKMEEGYDLVLGSRYLSGTKTEDDTIIRFIGNKLFTFMTNLIHGTKMTDCLYFFAMAKKDLFNSFEYKSNDFAFCLEVPVRIHKAGYKIGEVSCHERPRFADDSRVNALVDGYKIFKQMIFW